MPKIVAEAKPMYEIVIGKGVEKARQCMINFPYEAIDLPQALLPHPKQIENYARGVAHLFSRSPEVHGKCVSIHSIANSDSFLILCHSICSRVLPLTLNKLRFIILSSFTFLFHVALV